MTQRQLYSISLLTLAAACGGGSASLSATDAPAALAKAECTKALACCSGQSGAPTESACEAKISVQFQSSLSAILVDTKVTFNSSAAASCLSEINSGSCQLLIDGFDTPDCGNVLDGTVAVGGSCTSQFECQTRLCEGIPTDNSGNATGPGTCAATVAVGAACNFPQGDAVGDVCASGSYQNDVGSGCVCTAVQANGANCAGNEQCSSNFCDPTTSVCATFTQNTALSANFCSEVFQGF